MDKNPIKKWSLTTIKRKIITSFRNNNSILNECTLINVKRTFYLTIIAIPIRVLLIFLFITGTTSALHVWRQGIIISHFVLLVFFICVFFITYQLKNRLQTNATMHALQYIVPIIIMAFGIIIVTIDQLVTTNITPFLLTCIVVGAVFLIRPLISAAIYLTSYLVYYYLIALTITDPQVLLSNRVNGITAVGIGSLISIIIWHYNYINITQKRRIKLQQKQLEHMAYYDPLTDLPNRYFLNKMIEKELSSVQRYGHESVIMILDIDDFKNINDTHGHLVGDQVLKQMAQLLISNVRKSDTVSRLGGEEFVILAPKISLEEGFAFAERLRKLIAEKAFSTGSTTSQITVSFGVSLLQPTKNQGSLNYLTLADKALYRAKRKGKDKVEKI